ncbi:hypothetical protein DF3PB_220004 [uncultured Defluviicoccus sp.]|uniref:Uncharacterized protein n=1 Tax=metagenome TaxID=256318 RepID=A0A380TDY9_9ZZZZ|nr:hypothetical protein DF3PB_220004 [uncultured Defluviicoccus sp.]
MTSAQQLLDSYLSRIVNALPNDLQELADELREVVRYPDVERWALASSPESWRFLADTGLPKSCPTMIELSHEAQDLGNMVRIGTNSYGDLVCVEKATGAVVSSGHDGTGEQTQISSSPLAFLAAVCAYNKQDLAQTREAIRAIDPAAVEQGQWWFRETA